MSPLPLGVTRPMAASGGCAPISLVEVRTSTGNTYYWSEHDDTWNSVINGIAGVSFKGWLVGTQEFHLLGSTQTDTGSISVQNLSGNTVERDISRAAARNEFIGAYVYYRLWRSDAEQAIFIFTGNLVGVDIDDQQMDLQIEGFGNFSAVRAPAYVIDVTCPLYFGSQACGSTAAVPCDQSYGNCSSIERFAGVVVQWDFSQGIAPLVQIAQPAPTVAFNPARAF